MANLIKYGMNVGKSILYSTVEYAKTNMETINDTVENNSELFKEIYSDITNHKETMKKVDSAIKSSKLYEAADMFHKSLKEDLKNGTFYNKKRFEDVSAKAMGFDMSDMEDFSSLGDMDFDFDPNADDDNDDFSESNVQLGSMIDASSQANAEAITSSIASSSKYNAEVSKQNTKLLYIQNAQNFNLLQKSLGTMNANISNLGAILDISKQVGDNQKKYFEETTKLFQEQNAILKEMSENLKKIPGVAPPKEKKKSKMVTYSDVSSYSGAIDLKQYAKLIKQNFENNPDLSLISSTMNMMGEDSNPLLAFAANPLGMVMDGLISKAIPAANKKALKSLDKSIGSLFGNLTAMINQKTRDNYDDNGLQSIMKSFFRMFSADNEGAIKTKLRIKNSRDPMQWNGDDHVALTQVIPQSLARIESAITGEPEMVFDYATGKWKKSHELKKEFDTIKQMYANNGTYDLRKALFSQMDNMKFDSLDDQKSLKEDIKSLLQTLYESGEIFDFRNNKMDNYEYGVDSEENFEIIKGMFKALAETQNSALMEFGKSIMDARASNNSYLQSLEKEGSIYQQLFNGRDIGKAKLDNNGNIKFNTTSAYKMSPLNIKSKKGYTGFDYLDRITSELIAIRSRLFEGGFGSGGRRKSKNPKAPKGPNGNAFDLNNYSLPKKMDDIDKELAYDNYQNEYEEKEFERQQNDLKKNKDAFSPEDYDINDLSKGTARRLKNKEEREKEEAKIAERQSRTFTLRKFFNQMDDSNTALEKVDNLFTGLQQAVHKPFEFVEASMNKINKSLFEFFYGKDTNENDSIFKNPRGFLDAAIDIFNGKMGQMANFIDEKILEPLSGKINSSGGNLKDTILESLGLKDVGEKIHSWLFGDKDAPGVLTNTVNSVKKTFGNAKDTAKNAYKKAFNPVSELFTNHTFDDLDNPDESKAVNDFASGLSTSINETVNDYVNNNVHKHFKGADAKKAHIGVINENETVLNEDETNMMGNVGEYLIGVTKRFKAGRMKNSKVANRISGKLNKSLSGLEKGSDAYNKMVEGYRSLLMQDSVLDGMDDKKQNDYINILDAVFAHKDDGDATTKTKAGEFGKQVMGEFKNGYNKVVDALTKDDDEKNKKEKSKLGHFVDDMIQNAGVYAPDAVSSGLLGAGVSLLTGFVGGPLVGAALGAGISIARKSNTLQDMLFGTDEDIDENGNPTKFLGKMKKYLPDFRDFGIIGGTAGLLPFMPFGPITGIMMGAAASYAKNNKKANEFLFGDENGLLNKNKKDKLKKALPKMGAGALLGIIGGPFGILGNAAIGAGAGYLASTDKFNNWLFGEVDANGKRVGGVLPELRNKVIDPLIEKAKDFTSGAKKFLEKWVLKPIKNAFDPLRKQGGLILKGIFNAFKWGVDKVLESTLGVSLGKLGKGIAKPFLKLGKGLGKVAIGLGFAPVIAGAQAIGAAGNHYRKKQIKSGDADYMNAQQRLDYRDSHMMRVPGNIKGDRFRAMDEILAKSNITELETMRNGFMQVKKDAKKTKSERNKGMMNVAGTLNGYGWRDSKRIMKEVELGNYDIARKLIENNKKIPEEQKRQVLADFNQQVQIFKGQRRDFFKNNVAYQQMAESLKKQGIKLPKNIMNNPDKMDKYIKLIDKEIKDKRAMTPEERQAKIAEEEQDENKKYHKKIMTRIDDIIEALTGKRPVRDDSSDNDSDDTSNDESTENKENKSEFDKATEETNKKKKRRGKGKYKRKRENSEARANGEATDDSDKPRVSGNEEQITQETDLNESHDFRNKILNFFGIVKEKKNKVSDFAKSLMGKAGGLAKKGLLLAGAILFAKPILNFAKNKILPWITDKFVPFITDTVVPAIGNVLWSVAKGLGKFVVNGIGKFFKKLPIIGKLFPKTTSSSDLEKDLDNDQRASNNGKASASMDDASKQLKENMDSSYATSSDVENIDVNDTGNAEYDPEAKTVENGSNGNSKVIAGIGRSIATKGATGSVGKTVKNIGKVTSKLNKGSRVISSVLHPFKSGMRWIKGGSFIKGEGKLYKAGAKVGKGVEKLATKYDGFVKSGKAIEKAGKIASKVADKAPLIKSFLTTFNKFTNKLLTDSKIVTLIGADTCARIIEKGLGKIMPELSKKLAANVAKLGEKLAASISTGGLVNIAFAVADFIYGYNHADEILRVETPTFGEKIACAFVKAITGFFIIFTVIPDSFIMDILIGIFAKDDSKIKKQRADMEKKVQEYNEKNGTDLTTEEFIKKNKKEKSFIGKLFKSNGPTAAEYNKKNNVNTSVTAKGTDNSKPYKLDNKSLSSGGWNPGFGGFNDKKDKATGEEAKGIGGFYTGIGGGKQLVSKEQLDALGWHNSAATVNDLNDALVNYHIDSQNRIWHFLAQCANESGWGQATKEIDNGQRYEGRKDLGNTQAGDGPKYKGAGYIQVTGRANYQHFADAIHDPKVMDGVDYVAEKYPWSSAGYWWYNNKMNDMIDNGADVKAVTKRVNGGYTALANRQKCFEKVSSTLKGLPTTGTSGEPGNQSTAGSVSSSSDSNSSSSSTNSGDTGIAGLFSDIGKAFSNSVARHFGLSTDDSSSSSSSSDGSSGNSASGSVVSSNDVVKTAQSFIGDPYVWGGTGAPLTEAIVNSYRGTDHDISKAADWKSWIGKPGYDCSGFVQAVFKKLGKNIGRSTYDQVKDGTEVSKSDLQPGDIVLFGSKSAPHHVGIYEGNDTFIHAPASGKTIQESPLSSRKNFATARRIDGMSGGTSSGKASSGDGANDSGDKGGWNTGYGGPNKKDKATGEEAKGIGGPADSYFTSTLHGNVTSGFGHRKGFGKISSEHTGIDIGAQKGTKITSPIGGTVVANKSPDKSNGLGNMVAVKDGNNAIHYFGHMNNKSNLNVGQKINAGDKIGNIGSTGNSTGPHVHYETRVNGKPVDPNSYLEIAKAPKRGEKPSKNIGGPSAIDNKAINTIVALLTNIDKNINKIVNGESNNTSKDNNSSSNKGDSSMATNDILNKVNSSKNDSGATLSEMESYMKKLANE